jgi:hypothetical protein
MMIEEPFLCEKLNRLGSPGEKTPYEASLPTQRLEHFTRYLCPAQIVIPSKPRNKQQKPY